MSSTWLRSDKPANVVSAQNKGMWDDILPRILDVLSLNMCSIQSNQLPINFTLTKNMSFVPLTYCLESKDRKRYNNYQGTHDVLSLPFGFQSTFPLPKMCFHT